MLHQRAGGEQGWEQGCDGGLAEQAEGWGGGRGRGAGQPGAGGTQPLPARPYRCPISKSSWTGQEPGQRIKEHQDPTGRPGKPLEE